MKILLSHRPASFLVSALGILVVGPAVSAAIINGSFETPLVTSLGSNPNGVEINSMFDIGGWTLDRGSVDLFAAAGYYEVAEGNQAVFLSGGNAGSIYQDVSTIPGQSYTLRFAISGDPGKPGWPLIKNMAVEWDGNVIAQPTFDITATAPDNMGWQYLQYSVLATGNVTRLRFSSLDFDPTGPAVDDVSLTASVPESGSTLVFLAASGSILMGLSRRRAMHGAKENKVAPILT